MSISSFHSEKPTKHSVEHMNRKSKVTYLADPTSTRNEYWENKKLPSPEKFVLLAPTPYIKRVNQKIQKSQLKALIKEAVVNLNEHHTLKDVKHMMFVINKTLGGYVPFRIAVHKDEGVFVEYVGKLKDEWNPDDYVYNSKNFKWYEKSKDGKAGKEVTEIISYRPSRDYHYNDADKEWYEDVAFTKKADLSNKHIFYNYHAHVLYSAFDLNTGKGRSIRKDMRSLQTLVANQLKMQRGKRFSNTRRQTHWQRKAESDLLNDEKRDHKKTKLKSNELEHENAINNSHASFHKLILKNLTNDFKKHHIDIDSYITLKTEQKRLKELLSCSEDMSIEEGIQKIKEESQKIIDELKAEIEEKSKSIEDQDDAHESQISKLEKEVEELKEDVYSDRNIYWKKKKTIFKHKYKNLVFGKEKTIEKLKSKIEELEKQLKPTGYEIEGESVTEVVYDYVKAMEKTLKDVAEKEKNRDSVPESKVSEKDVEIENLNELVESNKTIYQESSENQLKERKKLEEKIKELNREAFYEKDIYIDGLDDYITKRFSYKSKNEELKKALSLRESELELAHKVLKTVQEYKIPSENLSGDIREIAMKVLDKIWPKRKDAIEVEGQSPIVKHVHEQLDDLNYSEFTDLKDEDKDRYIETHNKKHEEQQEEAFLKSNPFMEDILEKVEGQKPS